jgi:hypothetical protein
MPAHTGPVLAFMALLALAGIQKIADPKPTVGALAAAGLPASRVVVLALGCLEAATGVAGITIGGPVPALLAVGLYSGFAVFVVNALVRDLPLRSCGCLGASDTPPSVIHVLVNLAAVAAMLMAVIDPVDVIAQLSSLGTGEAVAFGLFTVGVVYLLYGTLTVLPLIVGRSTVSQSGQPIELSERSR